MNSHPSTITDHEISQLPPPPREWLEDIEREEQEIKNDFYYNYDELWNIILTEKERLEKVDYEKEEEQIEYNYVYNNLFCRMNNNELATRKIIRSFGKVYLNGIQSKGLTTVDGEYMPYRKMDKEQLIKFVLEYFMKFMKDDFDRLKKNSGAWADDYNFNPSFINRYFKNYDNENFDYEEHIREHDLSFHASSYIDFYIIEYTLEKLSTYKEEKYGWRLVHK